MSLYGPGYVGGDGGGNQLLAALVRNLGQLIDNLTAGQYTPADGSVTDAKVAAGAAIAQAKVAGLVADLAAMAGTYVAVPAGTPTVGQVLIVASVGPPVVFAWADSGTTPTPGPPTGDALLLETGDALLLETGDRLLIDA